MKKLRNLLAMTGMLLVLMSAHGRAQSALDGFDPGVNGTIEVFVVQPDGKILIGGTFDTVLDVTRNNIARLNPDGTLDAAFNPNADSDVESIAVQADGQILAGGLFTSIGGQARTALARLDATTGLADSFNPQASGGTFTSVYAIAVQADGKILAGGFFSDIGGQKRNNIARLDANTGLADAFDPNANDGISSIVVQADGKILAGGAFFGANSIGGATRNHIARLDPTTGLADSFDPDADSEFVSFIAVQADGKILAGGDFGFIGGQKRNHIARLDATTGLADSFDPNATDIVFAIVVQADGKILAGGRFNNIGGQPRNRLARLDSTTGQADSFNPNANADVFAVAAQADGKILAGGDFTALAPNGGAPVTRLGVARLEIDGRLDQTLDLGTVGGYVTATAVQPDGKLLIGGNFTTILGVPRNNIARLNTDGTVDTVFNPNANGDVISIAVQTDGKILAGGSFFGANSIGGATRNRIARLDGTTGQADSFDPNANSTVLTLTVQADGKILAGGQFSGPNSIGGATRSRIARLDATTGLADSFDPNASSNVLSIAVQADGKILASGDFNGANSIGGQTRNRMARLDGTTGLADSFDPNANNTVNPIAVLADGKILVGGTFSGANSIGGQTRNRMARLDATTGLADSFDPNASDAVASIAVQADGKILVGGDFRIIGGQMRDRVARLDGVTGLADSFDPIVNGDVFSIAMQGDGKLLVGGAISGIGGQPRSAFARLSNDTAVRQDLAVTQSTITWTRGGSSAHLGRVTFESSNDNVNYTPLGNGTPAGSNWTLSGLSLPTEQNIYIRARGYYRSGYLNGSESITESVRKAFIVGTTPTPPVITSPLSVSVIMGQSFVYQFEARGATSLGVSNLPPGLTFNTNLSAIIGTPAAVGTTQVGLSASNTAGTTKATLAIDVQPPPALGPIVQSGMAVTGRVGQPFRFQVYTTGGTSAARVSASGLPLGLTIDAVSGRISGTVTVEGSSAVTLTVTDGPSITTSTLQLTFTADSALPVIISPGSAALTQGQFFSYTINAPSSADPSDPTIFALIGTLPAGLTFDAAAGTISGIYLGLLRESVKDGAHQPELAGGTLGNVQLFASNSHGTSTFQLLFLAAPSGAVNISTRLRIGTEENVLIGGFIITGNAPKVVIVRALGPSTGVPGALGDPTLELHDGAGHVVVNDNWRSDQQQTIIETTIPPADDRESAIVAGLDPGSYTAIVAGKKGTTGIGLVEVYDLGTASLDASGSARLAQISTRGMVLDADNVMIGGFIISSQDTGIIVRAIGPSLTQFGVANALTDPTLELRDGSGSLIFSNDDWRSTQEKQIIATGVPPADDRESAIVATLTPGNYTGIVRGKDDTTGVALVEVYTLQ